jgi:hypothetical protein
VLNIDLGGTMAGTQFDQLNITGPATLAGTLNLDLINGFVPATGNSFKILACSSLSGTFDRVNDPNGVNLNPTYTGGIVMLS